MTRVPVVGGPSRSGGHRGHEHRPHTAKPVAEEGRAGSASADRSQSRSWPDHLQNCRGRSGGSIHGGSQCRDHRNRCACLFAFMSLLARQLRALDRDVPNALGFAAGGGVGHVSAAGPRSQVQSCSFPYTIVCLSKCHIIPTCNSGSTSFPRQPAFRGRGRWNACGTAACNQLIGAVCASMQRNERRSVTPCHKEM